MLSHFQDLGRNGGFCRVLNGYEIYVCRNPERKIMANNEGPFELYVANRRVEGVPTSK